MIAISAFAILWLGITSLVLIRNRFTFKPAGRGNRTHFESEASSGHNTSSVASSDTLVSICIPARNEEAVIERCLRSVLTQDYSHLEVIVLNDRSEDATADILNKLVSEFGSALLRVIIGTDRPDGWLGKPWACEQLGKEAKGEILIFLDADTWLSPNAVAEMVYAFHSDKADAITIWPEQVFESPSERIVIPMVYFTLLTLLPAEYVRRFPRWMPQFIRPYFKTAFAAACGQCIAFRREAYEKIGGHERVKDQVVEDVSLAKALKKEGFTLVMYHGMKQVYCRMYTQSEDILAGFRKNFLAGFGYSVPVFLMAMVLHIVVFIWPYAGLVFGLITGNLLLSLLCTTAICLIHAQRLVLDRMNNWNIWYGLLHPIGVLWFQRLGFIVLFDHFFSRDVLWKGRSINTK